MVAFFWWWTCGLCGLCAQASVVELSTKRDALAQELAQVWELGTASVVLFVALLVGCVVCVSCDSCALFFLLCCAPFGVVCRVSVVLMTCCAM